MNVPYDQFEKEAEDFFLSVDKSERAEVRAFQLASIKTLTRSERAELHGR